jgi:hypothetical protein
MSLGFVEDLSPLLFGPSPCSLLVSSAQFLLKYPPEPYSVTVKMEAAYFSETVEETYCLTVYKNPGEYHLRNFVIL